jgi:hypothetical protein
MAITVQHFTITLGDAVASASQNVTVGDLTKCVPFITTRTDVIAESVTT